MSRREHLDDPMDTIDARVASRSLLLHPFYQAWTRGELTPQSLRDYASQYYHHVAAFPTFDCPLGNAFGRLSAPRILSPTPLDPTRRYRVIFLQGS